MINIKTFLAPKKNGSSQAANSQTSRAVNNTAITNFINDWFYYDVENNAVVCRYDFYSVGNVAAYANSNSVSDTSNGA